MKVRILIVDDEKKITEMLSRYLTMEGYEVDSVNNPQEALVKIENENYGVVITDIVMPDMNGLDLLKEIKNVNGLIQVIVMTGYVAMENILTAFRLGASNCFFKPFESLEVIKKEVDNAIARFDRIREVLKTLKDYKPGFFDHKN